MPQPPPPLAAQARALTPRRPRLQRRRAQNRASQRAYRERKEQRIRDLEQLLREATQREHALAHAYAALRARFDALAAPGSLVPPPPAFAAAVAASPATASSPVDVPTPATPAGPRDAFGLVDMAGFPRHM